MVDLQANPHLTKYDWDKKTFDAVCYATDKIHIGDLNYDKSSCQLQLPDAPDYAIAYESNVTVIQHHHDNLNNVNFVNTILKKIHYLDIQPIGVELSLNFNIVEIQPTGNDWTHTNITLPLKIENYGAAVVTYDGVQDEVEYDTTGSVWIDNDFDPQNHQNYIETNLPTSTVDFGGNNYCAICDSVQICGYLIWKIGDQQYRILVNETIPLNNEKICLAVYDVHKQTQYNVSVIFSPFSELSLNEGLSYINIYTFPPTKAIYNMPDVVAVDYKGVFHCNGGSGEYTSNHLNADSRILFSPTIAAESGNDVKAYGSYGVECVNENGKIDFYFENFTYSVYGYDWENCDNVKATVENIGVVYFAPNVSVEVPLENINATANICPQLPKATVLNKSFNVITPACVCYQNAIDSKTVTYNITYNTKEYNPKFYNVKESSLRVYYDDNRDNILYDGVPNEEITLTFNLPENTVKHITFELYNGNFIGDRKKVIVERQEYCHSLTIEAKTYDLEGKEVAKFPHPTSADWKAEKYGEIAVKIKIKDEQGQFIDIPTDKIHTNWQYNITKVDTGQYEMKIPNAADETALPIGDYGIAIYVDKDWCDTNGYYNKYNIDAENIILNSDKIEKVGLWNFTGITNYENGMTNLNNIYEKVSGTFVNPNILFSIVQQLNEEKERHQYSYCYRIYDSPMTLNLPTYSEDEQKELAKAIVRELGQPRKVETFTILTKEIPKINQNITLNYDGNLLSIPVYSVSFSISNSNIQIDIKNDKMKLMKDYLQELK